MNNKKYRIPTASNKQKHISQMKKKSYEKGKLQQCSYDVLTQWEFCYKKFSASICFYKRNIIAVEKIEVQFENFIFKNCRNYKDTKNVVRM